MLDGMINPRPCYIGDDPREPADYGTKAGYCPRTRIYRSPHRLAPHQLIPTSPTLDTATYVLSHLPPPDDELASSKPALIEAATGRRVTYGQVRRDIRALSSTLRLGLGLKRGDVVLLLSPNSLLYPIICLAVLSTGAVLTAANPLSTPAEISKQATDSGATLAVATPEEACKIEAAGLKLPVLLTTTESSNDDPPLSVEELIEGGDPLDSTVCESTQSDRAAVLYTSGTTGVSKGVVMTHRNLISVVTLFKWAVDSWGATDDVYLAFWPMFQVYGLAFFALGLLAVGATVVVMPRFDLRATEEAVEKYGVSNIPAVPPVLLALANGGGDLDPSFDPSTLRRVSNGDAPMSRTLARMFRGKFPWVELRDGYGLTESGGLATLFACVWEAREAEGSVGRLLPEYEAKVVQVETGVAVGPGKVGELWLRGPGVMSGYLNDDQATAPTFDEEEGWLKTGDLCYFDDNGLLYFVDRIKELIKHNGYHIAPAELEAILLTHPDILDAAVIPIEDDEAGQSPMAYVVRKGHPSNLTEEAVLQFVASRVAPHKKVRKVAFTTSVQRSAAGKILRKDLIALNKRFRPSKL